MTPLQKFIYECVNYVVNVADNDQSIAIVHEFEDGDSPDSDWSTLAKRVAGRVAYLETIERRIKSNEDRIEKMAKMREDVDELKEFILDKRLNR